MDLKMTNAGDYMNFGRTSRLETINFLNACGLEALKVQYGIKVTQTEEYPDLYVLNYCQINSSKFKFTDIVRECRSLVVQECAGKWHVVSQSFDRFFNYGEGNEEFDITELKAYEKVDGSLVSVFFHNGKWNFRTKSMINPNEDAKMVSGRSWKELIESMIIGPFNDHECTYIFEVVSQDNRVVTRYDDDAAYLLAVRNNKTGNYWNESDVKQAYIELSRTCDKIKLPKSYTFGNMEDALKAAKELPNLEEGYVMYDYDNVPVQKVKSPAYVAAHRLRGESVLTPKRIVALIQINEQDEYLAIFPEDTKYFKPWINRRDYLINDFYSKWQDVSKIEDQKAFALTVMKTHKHISGFFFQKRQRGTKVVDMMNALQPEKLVSILEHY